jgi:hypothetical protein
MRMFIALTCLFLTACVTTQSPYTHATSSWQGESIQRIIDQWGPPDTIKPAPNGHQWYVYTTVRQGTYPTPPSPHYVPTVSAGKVVMASYPTVSTKNNFTLSCITRFEVNAKNIIVGVDSKGTGCVKNNL